MKQQSKAKIFLADERGTNQTDWFRCYSTFNFGNFYSDHKRPFENLFVLNDKTLAPGHDCTITVGETTLVYLLPIVGTFRCRDSDGNQRLINPGELFVSYLDKNTTLQVENPFETDLINFLEIRLRADSTASGEEFTAVNFNLKENQNRLVPVKGSITKTATILLSLGMFAGRNDALCRLINNQSRLFIFVIQGVFEAQGRLLHARDGLALWDEPGDIELEALSNDAIVLLIEQNCISLQIPGNN